MVDHHKPKYAVKILGCCVQATNCVWCLLGLLLLGGVFCECVHACLCVCVCVFRVGGRGYHLEETYLLSVIALAWCVFCYHMIEVKVVENGSYKGYVN